jgi:hypothetical protein
VKSKIGEAMSKKQNSSGGISMLSVLTLIFVTLKLIGEISWSWIWVLSPIWIPFALVIIGVLIVLALKWLFFGLKKSSNKDEWEYWNK